MTASEDGPRAPAGAPSIGQVTMGDDGTIILDVRAEGPHGALGYGRLVYPVAHPQYRQILMHVGGLKPGEHKPVPPWDD